MELAVDRVEVTGEADADRAADACNVEFGVAVEDAALVGGGGHRKLLRFHIRRLIRFISPISSKNAASGANPRRVVS